MAPRVLEDCIRTVHAGGVWLQRGRRRPVGASRAPAAHRSRARRAAHAARAGNPRPRGRRARQRRDRGEARDQRRDDEDSPASRVRQAAAERPPRAAAVPGRQDNTDRSPATPYCEPSSSMYPSSRASRRRTASRACWRSWPRAAASIRRSASRRRSAAPASSPKCASSRRSTCRPGSVLSPVSSSSTASSSAPRTRAAIRPSSGWTRIRSRSARSSSRPPMPTGHVIRDTVVLPPFEITDQTEVTSILLETGVYDKTGRFISDLAPAAFTVRENGVRAEDRHGRARNAADDARAAGRQQPEHVAHAWTSCGWRPSASPARCASSDNVIVAPFNAHIGTITGPTNDAPTITQAIAAMQRRRRHGDSRRPAREHQAARGARGPARHHPHHRRVRREQHDADRRGRHGRAGGAGHRVCRRDRRRGGHLAEGRSDAAADRRRDGRPHLLSAARARSRRHRRCASPPTPTAGTSSPTRRRISARTGRGAQVAVDVPEGYHVRTRAGYFAPTPAADSPVASNSR